MPLPLIATGLFGFFGSVVGKFLTDSLLKFTAYKILAITLLTVTLPIVIKNLITWLFEQLFSIVSSSVDMDGLSATVVHLTGYTAYLASHLMLPDCISIIMTAVGIRLVLNFIPMVG